MIISHLHRYLFVEVPHTASTAISRELCEHYDGRRILHKHANYVEFLRQCSPEEKSYYVFAGIRHPLDIIVTEYSKFLTNHKEAFTDENRRSERGGWVDREQLVRFQFVQTPGRTFADYVRRFYDRIYHNWFLVGHDRFHRIVRYESVGEGFEAALADLNISTVRELPVVNSSRRDRDFTTYYDTADLRAHMVWSCGPFMRKWGFEFPPDWPAISIPPSARVRFNLQEGAIQSVGRYLYLDPTSPTLQRIKKLCRQS
jgi:hypothetical protein